jgi:hypothetical protein
MARAADQQPTRKLEIAGEREGERTRKRLKRIR